jgi:tRNA threonylcarbamoyladenosine biosynthesis protein TsaB
MNILAIDTATEYLGLILECQEKNLSILSNIGYRHSETLIPYIEYLCKEMDIKPKELDLVVCGMGPGSFTGLRIGLATAKGICTGSGCPLVAVPTLDALAYGLRLYSGIVIPVIDAKKKCFYSAVYDQGRLVGDYLDLDPAALLALINKYKEVLLTGPHAPLALEKIKETANPLKARIDLVVTTSDPPSLLELGKIIFKEKGETPLTVSPLYIRKSEAEILKGI